MTISEQIAARLAEILPVYEEIAESVREWERLQQAEAARAEYERETSEFDRELEELARQKELLEAEKRKLKLRKERGPDIFRPPPPRPAQAPVLPFKHDAVARPAPRIDAEAIAGARRQLKKLVGRWGHVWRLSSGAQGRINRIADDPARPLGEAIAMLDWETFVRPVGRAEGEAAHLERLNGWGESLREYRRWLKDDIDVLRTKYRRVLPLLDVWLGRETGEGRVRWQTQIADTLAAKRQELETLRADIGRLRDEIERLS